MHEISIAQAIIKIAIEAIPLDSHGDVISVELVIGQLSGIEVAALEFALSVMKKNTALQMASFQIDIIEGKAMCKECKNSFSLSSFDACCPLCFSYSFDILQGQDMRVANIEIEED